MSTARRNPREPWVVGSRRRLATSEPLEHLDDLVKLVLLTGPNERLHRPGFGAGLGASTLFEPLSTDLAGTVQARARGSLADVLGARLDVIEVTVTVEESTLSARVVYRPKPSGDTRTITMTLPGAAL
jgi:phage baseplate assembly protein W